MLVRKKRLSDGFDEEIPFDRAIESLMAYSSVDGRTPEKLGQMLKNGEKIFTTFASYQLIEEIKHRHLAEKERLQAILKEESNLTHSGKEGDVGRRKDAQIRLNILLGIIAICSQNRGNDLCYEDVCTLMGELL